MTLSRTALVVNNTDFEKLKKKRTRDKHVRLSWILVEYQKYVKIKKNNHVYHIKIAIICP